MVALMGSWSYTGARKRPWTAKMRDITLALKSIGFDPKVRRKPNIGLLFALAQWGQLQKKLPKKSLRDFIEDGPLFDLLRLHREVPMAAYGLCDLTPEQLTRLEKRLNHRWPLVACMVEAMNQPNSRLRAENTSRRKRQRSVHNPRLSTFSATLAQLDS
jgi:hypothetical protein